MFNGYWFVTTASQAALVPLIAWWARRRAGLSLSWTAAIVAILAAWQLAVIALAAGGAFLPREGVPPVVGLAVFVPIALGVLALWRLDAHVPPAALASLMALQVLRIEGFEFVVASRTGHLPAHFGEPAGWGDTVIGVTAPLVALAVARGWKGWRAVATAWNVAGIADLANAVAMGMLSAPGLLNVFHGVPTTQPLTELPLSLVPTFGVPLAVLGHVIALRGLRDARRQIGGLDGSKALLAGGA